MLRPKYIAQKPTMTALPLQRCLAKTYTSSQGIVLPGRTVFEHACIVGEIAQALIGLYPPALREIFFPLGSACVVSVHDVGKILSILLRIPFFQRLHQGQEVFHYGLIFFDGGVLFLDNQ